MSNDTSLPTAINAITLAREGRSLEGYYPLTSFERLAELLSAADGDVLARVKLGRNKDEFLYLKIKVEATVGLQCQRCLEVFKLPIQSTSTVYLLSKADSQSEESIVLPEGAVSLVLEDELDLFSLVEDELILSIPQVPKHPGEVCAPYWEQLSSDAGANPFSVLGNYNFEQI